MDHFKTNRKSLRFTDKVCEHVEAYRGDSFNEKLENMVLDYEERRDVLLQEWDKLQRAVLEKHQELIQVQDRLRKVRTVEARFTPLVDALTMLLPQE